MTNLHDEPIDESTFIVRTSNGEGVEIFTYPNKVVSTPRLTELRDFAVDLLARSADVPGRSEICSALQRWIDEANDDIELHTAPTGEEALRLAERQIEKF